MQVWGTQAPRLCPEGFSSNPEGPRFMPGRLLTLTQKLGDLLRGLRERLRGPSGDGVQDSQGV